MSDCAPEFEQHEPAVVPGAEGPPGPDGPEGPPGPPGPAAPERYQADGVVAPIQYSGTTWTTIGTCVLDATLAGADFAAAGTLTFLALFAVALGASGAASLRLIRVSDAVVALTVSTSSTTPVYETVDTGSELASAYYVQAQTADPTDVLQVWYAGTVYEVP